MKNRGQRRYYKNLKEKDDLGLISELKLEYSECWYNLWHIHFDEYGYGNNSFKKRKVHLDRLFRHFDLIAEKYLNLDREFQLFAVVFDRLSSEDGLYIHTPNPIEDNYPHKVPDLSLSSSFKNKDISRYLTGLKGYMICYAENNGVKYSLVYKENLGRIPLELSE
jgi:hypothetical protein